MSNLTWDWDDEGALMSALAGSGLGDTLADGWPEIVRRKSESTDNISRYLEIGSEDVVAEIGAGVGLVTAGVARLASRVISLDVSESFQKIAKTTASSANVEFYLIENGSLGILRGTGVNKIFSEGCFIHLNLFDIYSYAKQAFDLLPPGGLLAFDIANADRQSMWEDLPWREHYDSYHKNKQNIWQMQAWHSPATICHMLVHLGYFVEAVRTPTWMYCWLIARKN